MTTRKKPYHCTTDPDLSTRGERKREKARERVRERKLFNPSKPPVIET
jgi:hypothetical protein